MSRQIRIVVALFFTILFVRSSWADETETEQGAPADDEHTIPPTPAEAVALTAPPPLPTPVTAADTSLPIVVTRPPARSYKPLATGVAMSQDEPTQMGAPQPITADMHMMDSPHGGEVPMMMARFKPETKDELFARIDTNRDGAVNFDDYLKRDRFYVEAVRNEFEQIDTNRDARVSKREFDDYIERLEDQRKLSLLRASNFTLQRHDHNGDGALNENELGAYINGSLQRDTTHLPEIFKQFDTDNSGKLELQEFNELDFHFPWGKFPLKESAFMQAQMEMGGAPGASLYGPEATVASMGPPPPMPAHGVLPAASN